MTKSIKRISILGLVLTAASAVTAAVLPSKADNKDRNMDDRQVAGSLTNHSSINNAGAASSLTCAPETGTVDHACNYSTGVGSETTGADLNGNDDSTTVSSRNGLGIGDGGLGGDNTSDAS